MEGYFWVGIRNFLSTLRKQFVWCRVYNEGRYGFTKASSDFNHKHTGEWQTSALLWVKWLLNQTVLLTTQDCVLQSSPSVSKREHWCIWRSSCLVVFSKRTLSGQHWNVEFGSFFLIGGLVSNHCFQLCMCSLRGWK